jgi:hypothetical protein
MFASRIGIIKLFYFQCKTLQRKKKKKDFLSYNFRLAVNMLQLIYALKSTTIDGFQRLPSPGFHLNTRYIPKNKFTLHLQYKFTNRKRQLYYFLPLSILFWKSTLFSFHQWRSRKMLCTYVLIFLKLSKMSRKCCDNRTKRKLSLELLRVCHFLINVIFFEHTVYILLKIILHSNDN